MWIPRVQCSSMAVWDSVDLATGEGILKTEFNKSGLLLGLQWCTLVLRLVDFILSMKTKWLQWYVFAWLGETSLFWFLSFLCSGTCAIIHITFLGGVLTGAERKTQNFQPIFKTFVYFFFTKVLTVIYLWQHYTISFKIFEYCQQVIHDHQLHSFHLKIKYSRRRNKFVPAVRTRTTTRAMSK